MVRILSNTPAWVFVLFLALLAVGLLQTRTRAVPRTAAFLLPAGMIVLSLAGIQSSFGVRWLPLVCWGLALAVATLAGTTLLRDRRVAYDATARRFTVPGSWGPLAVIMAIFFAKYGYAVLRAVGAEVIFAPLFIAGLASGYGLLSGYFAARALHLVRKVQAARAPATMSVSAARERSGNPA